jgi:hypothetical protein
MEQISKREVNPDELEKLGALLQEHDIEALVAKHKPQSISIGFDAEWLEDDALAASFTKIDSAKPYFITLSPLLLQYGLTDREAFSTIILHELGHIVDRFRNWTRYVSLDAGNHEVLEYEADDFVIACGWKDSLVKTLRRVIALGPKHRASEGMARKRLSRLSDAN